MKIISAKFDGNTFESYKVGDLFRKADARIYMKTDAVISETRKVNSVQVSLGLLAWTYPDERCQPITTITMTKEEQDNECERVRIRG